MVLTRLAFDRSSVSFKNWCTTFVLAWILSIAAGMVYAVRFENLSSSLMRASLLLESSFFQLLLSLLVPLTLSALCIYFHIFPLLCFISCVDGMSFGYCMCGSLLAFDSAGWLMVLFLVFPHLIMQTLLFWLCFRFFCGKQSSLYKDFFLCIALTVIAFGLYLLCFLPFINDLLYLLQEEGIAYSCWI